MGLEEGLIAHHPEAKQKCLILFDYLGRFFIDSKNGRKSLIKTLQKWELGVKE